MKKLILFSILCIGIIAFTSCSKDDGPSGSKGKTAKFTISAPGLDGEDFVLFAFTGSNGAQIVKTPWKINGVTQDNQTNIRIENEHLTGGKTVIVETAVPLDNIIVTFGGHSDETPYTLKFKAEINGKVENEISDQVTGATYSKQFTYVN
ncbi:MAG: hypothetical protein PHO94_12560 [Petrimonas sp.]|nr:hypothetical protein [Petrimonas sp.]